MEISTVKVNTVKLQRDARLVNSSIEKMKKCSEEVEQSVKELSKSWEGQAKSAFEKEVQSDLKRVDSALKEITALYNYELEAAKSYEKYEKKIESLICSLKI